MVLFVGSSYYVVKDDVIVFVSVGSCYFVAKDNVNVFVFKGGGFENCETNTCDD